MFKLKDQTIFNTAGEGTFTGQFNGNALAIEIHGQDTSRDTCTYIRHMLSTRIAKEYKIRPSDGTAVDWDWFGHSVSISGGYAIVGSPGSFAVYDRVGSAYIYNFSILPADSDNDGLIDDIEVAGCTDLNNPDSEDDGILDGTEDANHNGIKDPGETDPCNRDTDSDGMPDGWEGQYSLNPLVDDALEDADGDGYSNLEEYRGGSDPTDRNSLPKLKAMPWIPLLLLDN